MYYDLNDSDFLKVDFDTCFRRLESKVRGNKYVRVLKRDSEIIAWIYAEKGKSQFEDCLVFQQVFYASNQSGTMAYKCVKLLHEDMIEEAKRQGCKLVQAMGSHMDPDFVYARILEKLGWKRRGFLAIRYLELSRSGA
jgi:hypothetical protein